jgi:hypothetical protein
MEEELALVAFTAKMVVYLQHPRDQRGLPSLGSWELVKRNNHDTSHLQ